MLLLRQTRLRLFQQELFAIGTVIALIACVLWTTSTEIALAQTPDARDIQYKVTPSWNQGILDVYKVVGAAKAPVVLFVHSGGWYTGDKSESFNVEMYKHLRNAGFNVVTINYRLAPTLKYPAQLYDIDCALRWISANATAYNFDLSNVHLMGYSAGGHLSLLSALNTGSYTDTNPACKSRNYSRPPVKRVVSLAGPVDLAAANFETDVQKMITDFLPDNSSKVVASPITYVEKAETSNTSYMLVHGSADKLIPFDQGTRMLAAFKTNNYEAYNLWYSGVGHDVGQYFLPHWEAMMANIEKFLRGQQNNIPPTISFSASPTSITSGRSSTLTWSSTNATACSGTGFTVPGSAIIGTVTVSPTQTTTYTITCTGGGGTATANVSVGVTSQPFTQTAPPTLSFTANPMEVSSGGSTQLNWSSTGATLCVAGGGWSGYKSAVGTETIANLTGTRTFILACSGSYGTALKVVTVSVKSAATAPKITITASPTSITSGQSSTLEWDSTNATACLSMDFTVPGSATVGTVTVSPTQTTTYTIACTGNGGVASRSVTINVEDAIKTGTFSSPIRGEVSKVTSEATGGLSVSGWACAYGDIRPIEVYVRAGSAQGNIIARSWAALNGPESLITLCGSDKGEKTSYLNQGYQRHNFWVYISPQTVNQYAGSVLYAEGVHKDYYNGSQQSAPLVGSGKFSMPYFVKY